MSGAILTMPRLGETMEEGRIVGWLIAEGDAFKRGDPILEIETDKTVAELPALTDGVLAEKLVQPGDMIVVGAPIARLKGEAGVSPAPAPAASGRVTRTLAMPRLGETMEEGRIVGWMVQPGADFKRGDGLFEIETDKTVAEFPALMDGTLVEPLVELGSMVPVGAPLARVEIATADAGMEGFLPDEATPPVPAPRAASMATAPATTAPATTAPVATAVAAPPHAPADPAAPRRATPIARRLAARAGIDLAALHGTGRRGRIEARDIEAALAGGTVAAPGAIAFDRHGTPGAARRALLLHGFAGDRTTFAAFASQLGRAGYDVLVPDLPGHGGTRAEVTSIADLAAPLPGFLAAQGFGPTEIVAHSLGSVVAVALAQTLPGVERLTLLCPAGLGLAIDMEFIAGMASRPSPGALRHLLRRLTARPAGLSDAAVTGLAATLGSGRLAMLADDAFGPKGQKVDIVEALARLSRRMNVRIVFGLDDRILPWTQVTAAPSPVAIHLVAGAGHMPHWDQPGEVLALFDGDAA
ncbi:alpha/beta fold hydrolase [Ancylobacter amanitiformis]|uniref:Pyruvate dehydrogenase E2 component (Dihydrolipoamide acetyltransferase) n=1 Tax=Ancylobacter amanitiformis TaxID=217069 RepID=A0ABU0LMZ3_9HYPH|nr:alpha/beta fold hydrolase [Ancylobacter amanitiformis]MDQ0510044.1 pyruvate dehydrogenase E2 component (dihydrolipoamide acetyltransferase) [Ancylobacter amanitiformis]